MLISLLRYYLTWIALFIFERLIFVIYFYSKIFPISIKEFILIFLYGLRMDASMAAYISALPLLFFIAQWTIPSFWVSTRVLKIYSLIIVFLNALIAAVNVNIYKEWGTKIPYRAISTFIEYPYEAYISASSSPIIIPLLIFSVVFSFGYFLLTFQNRPLFYPNRRPMVKVLQSILLCGVLFILIRSGLQTTPLNPSMAYFSSKPILNHAAVNTEWNLLSDFLHSRNSKTNPFERLNNEKAKELISPYINIPSNPLSILKHPNPNVVFIILESFTADLIESLGGESNITPNFESLINNGLLFNNIYASSDRTDKGIIAIMSAFPSQATNSIIKNVNKLENLPGIGSELKNRGYHTSFFYGGESAFYNIRSYMLSHGIDDIIDLHNFPLKNSMSKWGAYDHLVFEKQLSYLKNSEQPFFSTLLTLSNHEPFDLPTAPKFGSKSLANLFRSTAFYTDSVMHAYFKQAKKAEWYKNTLFIIIADHGHRLPKERWDINNPNRYKIPLLFYGEVLKDDFKGKKVEIIGNQTDLASTLLPQLGIDSKNFFWSRDLLDPYSAGFSFFTWNNGFGVITAEQSLSYDNVSEQINYLNNPNAQDSLNKYLESVGKAYLQETYRQYLEY